LIALCSTFQIGPSERPLKGRPALCALTRTRSSTTGARAQTTICLPRQTNHLLTVHSNSASTSYTMKSSGGVAALESTRKLSLSSSSCLTHSTSSSFGRSAFSCSSPKQSVSTPASQSGHLVPVSKPVNRGSPSGSSTTTRKTKTRSQTFTNK